MQSLQKCIQSVFLPQLLHISHSLAEYPLLTSKFFDLQLEKPDVFNSLPVLGFTLV